MKQAIATLLVCVCTICPAALAASGSNAFQQGNLTADVAGKAAHTDAQLLNPWGIAFFPGNPFWVSDNNSGVSTLYDGNGVKQSLIVTIPTATGSGSGTPTGIVANTTSKFNNYFFIFDTEDGLIVGWNGGTTGIVAARTTNAVYKGLALVTNNSGPFLLAANFNSGTIDVFDGNLHAASLAGNFTDPTLPSGYAPFGIHTIGSNVYVTWAKQDAAKHDPVLGKGLGYVSVFDVNGNFVSRFASAGNLNAPWGVVMAPSSGFGAFSGALLIGNFGGGAVNAYNAATGKFMAAMKDGTGKMIVNPGLWDMVFGAGGTGNPNTLYFTAGAQNESHGLFGGLSVVPVSLLPGKMNFTTPVNQTSAAKTAMLTNNTSSSITINSVMVSDNHFVITSNTCAGTLAAGATCKIKVAFAPTATGKITGTLSVTDSGAGSPQQVKLTGTGT